MKIPYNEFSGFENLYLEDSYLLDIKESENELCFLISAALMPQHALYKEPIKKERYYYRNIEIIFLNVINIKWLNKSMKLIPSKIESELDYGNIDALYKVGNRFHIEGEWGALEFNADNPKIITNL